jgi:hypothetical protein
MKNWETKDFKSNFHDGMNCSLCPAKEFCDTRPTGNDCVNIFFDYAMKECVKPVKKMTMQEWANITGMPVAKDKDGIIYLYPSMEIKKGDNVWKSDASSCLNITDRVTDAEDHDWNIPCYPEENEPEGDENE